MYYEAGVKSDYGLAVKYKGIFYGTLIIHFTEKVRHLTHEEFDFMKTLKTQTAIALYQAELYSSVQKTAEKERILKEIISSIKISHTLEELYNYLLEKFSDVFSLNRAFFVETSDFEAKEQFIKYEYKKDSKKKFLKDEESYKKNINTLLELIKNTDCYIVNDILTFYPENEELQTFFKKSGIKSFVSMSLIRRNEDKIILGKFVLCDNESRQWSKNIALIKEILNYFLTVIWEIIKKNEIDELRNTFILTLAHDLQVPLVGERRALEFILSIPPQQLLCRYKDLIAETIKNNINLSNFLSKLVDSYTYELERKRLLYYETNINELIKEVILNQKSNADSKSISIETYLANNIPSIQFDNDEIKKVIGILLRNAIEYTAKGGIIKIKSSLNRNDILICCSDNGCGISKEIQNRLFKRYETALSIQRKIGSGLELYLAKQIVEAHKGKIYYETEVGKGTTFCFTLPIVI